MACVEKRRTFGSPRLHLQRHMPECLLSPKGSFQFQDQGPAAPRTNTKARRDGRCSARLRLETIFPLTIARLKDLTPCENPKIRKSSLNPTAEMTGPGLALLGAGLFAKEGTDLAQKQTNTNTNTIPIIDPTSPIYHITWACLSSTDPCLQTTFQPFTMPKPTFLPCILALAPLPNHY